MSGRHDDRGRLLWKAVARMTFAERAIRERNERDSVSGGYTDRRPVLPEAAGAVVANDVSYDLDVPWLSAHLGRGARSLEACPTVAT